MRYQLRHATNHWQLAAANSEQVCDEVKWCCCVIVWSFALHYLLDVHELNPRVRDRNLSTLMHIVCMHGHVEAFSYLMKKEVEVF